MTSQPAAAATGGVREFLTIGAAQRALRAGALSCVELTRSASSFIESVDPILRSFVVHFADQALAAAQAADAELCAGADVGALHGIPVAVKDIIATAESAPVTHTAMLNPRWSPEDAVAVARVRGAGAIVLGTTTMMEFAVGLPDGSPGVEVARNPWELSHWAGGSSSGSAAAVASGAVLGALGTDTAGSIRMPAAFCGITGLMPTYGLVPRRGVLPLAYSVDRVGPMARSAGDCAMLLNVLAGSAATEPKPATPDYLAALTGELAGVRVGVNLLSSAGAQQDASLGSCFFEAVEALESLGAIVSQVELPYYQELTAANVIILLSEGLSVHLDGLRANWAGYQPSTRMTLAAGLCYSAADYLYAQRVRKFVRAALAQLYREVDLIITPTASAGAPSLAALKSAAGAVGSALPTLYTGYWNAAGYPALSAPMGFTSAGLPLGLQIAGRPFEDAQVLRAADAYQRATSWHAQLPVIETAGVAAAGPLSSG